MNKKTAGQKVCRKERIPYLMIVFPLFLNAVWSWVENWRWPHLFPGHLSLRAWENFFSPTSGAVRILLYSILLSLVVTVLVLILCTPAARVLALEDFKGKNLVRFILFLPLVIPVTSFAMGLHERMIRWHLANTFFGVVLVHMMPAMPYAFLTLEPVFHLIGREYEDQASLLGAGRWHKFWHITFPLLRPGLLNAASLVFIISYSQYFLTFMIGGGKIITFSMLLFPYVQEKDRHMAAVYSLIFVLSGWLIVGIMRYLAKKGEYYGRTGR